MTDRNEAMPTPAEKRTQEALRAVERPAADPAFRARLRDAFTTGTLAEQAPARRAPAAPGPIGGTRAWFARPAFRLALAAAAAVMVVGVATLNRGGDWALASVAGTGTVLIGDVPVTLEDREQLQRLLRPGVRVTLPAEGELTLFANGTLALQLTPGTEITIPEPPARWFGRSSRMDVRSGEVRISTGPRFRGARFAVRTPLATAEITGTTIAVILEPEFACVCVLDGTASVGAPNGQRAELATGMRRFFYRNDSPSLLQPIDDMQRMKLTMFRDAAGLILK